MNEHDTESCDHEGHHQVEFGLYDAREENREEECAWCGFDTVDAGVLKERVHWLWLCEKCLLDMEMYAMNGGLRQ